MAAATAAGADWESIREGLRTFRGVRRRMEVRGEAGGVTVVDDFAHHPTAVAATLGAARQRFRGRRLIAVFEPRSYTAQRREFQVAYGAALGKADHAIVAGLFRPDRYDDATRLDPIQLVESLRARGTEADYLPAEEAIVSRVVRLARPGDVVLVMSNGGFGGIHELLLAALGAGSRAGDATGSVPGGEGALRYAGETLRDGEGALPDVGRPGA